MPFDTGEAGTSFVDWLSGAPLARGVLGSPPLTALLLTALAAVILMSTFPPSVRANYRAAARAALYFCAAASLVLFVHHRFVARAAGVEAATQSAREVHAGVERGPARSHPLHVAVAPRAGAGLAEQRRDHGPGRPDNLAPPRLEPEELGFPAPGGALAGAEWPHPLGPASLPALGALGAPVPDARFPVPGGSWQFSASRELRGPETWERGHPALAASAAPPAPGAPGAPPSGAAPASAGALA